MLHYLYLLLNDYINILSITSIVIDDSSFTTIITNDIESFIKDYITDKPLNFTIINDELYFGSIRFKDIIFVLIIIIISIPTLRMYYSDYKKRKYTERNLNLKKDITYRKLIREETLEILEFEEKRTTIERRIAQRRTSDVYYDRNNKRTVMDRRSNHDRRKHQQQLPIRNNQS